jgi:signal transduction histidine kinase
VRLSIKRLVFGTFGQTAILVTVALLVAQGLGFFLLVNESDRWQLLGASQPAIDHFVALVQNVEHAKPEERMAILMREGGRGRHLAVGSENAVDRLRMTRSADIEHRLTAALREANVPFKTVKAASAGFRDSPRENGFPRPFFPGGPSTMRVGGPVMTQPGMPGPGPDMVLEGAGIGVGGPPGGPPPGMRFGGKPPTGFSFRTERPPGFEPDAKPQMITLAVKLTDGTWLSGQYFSFSPSTSFLSRLALAEIILFATVLSVTLVVAMRLSRPMRILALASDRLGSNQILEPLAERGPLDARAAITSFNAMAKRVSDLLREKDQMLGAIGHDLRTPLASLRIRAETVEPPAERRQIIETLDDMQKLLDEILDLARLAHSGEGFIRIDLTALADSVAEEFRELGNDVSFVESERAVLALQPRQTKRMVRNLVENAVKFGGSAELRIEQDQAFINLLIADKGPGIPEEELERVTEPFVRLESSRNRDTGGTGLGLSIAQAVARRQGAELLLENRESGGLLVTVRWPRPEQPL